MKHLFAKLSAVIMTRVSGIGPNLKQYDPADLQIRCKITEGPESMIDRTVTLRVSAEALIAALPTESALLIRDRLSEILTDYENKEKR